MLTLRIFHRSFVYGRPRRFPKLDIRDLRISAVEFKGAPVKFEIAENGALGQELNVQLGAALQKGEEEKLQVTYTTSPNGATALQFMEKELTSDKKGPFLYSQCQAIHARSIVPSMDTPAVKQTYSAEVSVPSDLVCLMSGLSTGSEVRGDRTVFRFEQPVAVPSYLIAIVVGVLAKRNISERCAVWAEASVVEKAAWEFADTEKMLQTAEQLMGPYEWGRYDMVVLPAFNPCLTFITPTLIAGDRSLANVVAHEIAHFVDRKPRDQQVVGTLLVERGLHGARQFENITGWEDELIPEIHETFSTVHEYTKLVQNLGKADPDDAFSRIPYDKGSAFLLYLEQQLGSNERFEEFLKAYVKKFRRQSISSDDWLAFLREFFADKKEVLERVDFDGWLNKPGVPPNKPNYDESLVQKCRDLAAKWTAAPLESLGKEDAEEAPNWTTSGWLLLEKAYGLDKTGNYELLHTFYQIALKAEWPPVVEKALQFVTVCGRMKYVKPLYKRLFAWPHSRQQALDTLQKNKPVMHPITFICVSNLLQPQK
ncbi:Leukotriene A-4 hydrolase [Aphelenchoides fujianensis]|nr:Leukotriene A-4 hydrolase [Aphelenchoides fujianensis]